MADADDIQLAPMHTEHLDAVVEIEAAVFSNPWLRRDFAFSLDRDNGVCLVVLSGGCVIGYVVGFVVGREFHLADFAIAPAHQQCGFGRRALERVFAMLAHRVQVVSLEVRMSNQAAIALYKGMGFETMAIQRGYYSRPSEDALVMLKALNGRLSDWVSHALPDSLKNRESA